MTPVADGVRAERVADAGRRAVAVGPEPRDVRDVGARPVYLGERRVQGEGGVQATRLGGEHLRGDAQGSHDLTHATAGVVGERGGLATAVNAGGDAVLICPDALVATRRGER